MKLKKETDCFWVFALLGWMKSECNQTDALIFCPIIHPSLCSFVGNKLAWTAQCLCSLSHKIIWMGENQSGSVAWYCTSACWTVVVN